MMTHEDWADRLSEYLDGELSHGERAALEAHLADCRACRAVLGELRAVVATARALPDLPPSRDLWSGVAERTAGVVPFRPRMPRALPRWTRLAAAAALFAAVGSGATWLAMQGGGTTPLPTVAPAGGVATTQAVATAPRGTGAAVAELEALVRQGQSRLDTATVRIVTENLARIDQAIAEAQRALAADPSNAYVSRHLADTERRQLELLRTAARIVQSQS